MQDGATQTTTKMMSSVISQSQRGGKRAGAGRKPSGYRAFNIRISEDAIARIKELAKERGVSSGEVVMDCLKLAK